MKQKRKLKREEIKRELVKDLFEVPDIDLNRLDEEWIQQPRIRSQCADLVAEAKRDVEIASKEFEEAKAEVGKDIRTNYLAYGLEKCTDSAVKELVPLQKEYKEALMAWIDAKYKLDKLTGRSIAVNDRKHSLENLVELRLADYFGDPRPRSENGRKAIEHIKQEKAFERMKRRREDDDE